MLCGIKCHKCLSHDLDKIGFRFVFTANSATFALMKLATTNEVALAPRVTVGSLFAGIGGFCSAYIRAGAEVAWANEVDANACRTYRANFEHRLIEKSIMDLGVEKDNLSPVDILTAGFPCQPFSKAGNKLGFADQRGQMFFQIIRLIEEFGENKPKILFFENVSNFKTHDEGRTFATVKEAVKGAGYWFSEANTRILNTRTHSVIPQNRERIFMVAYSQDYFSGNQFVFPELEPEENRKVVGDYLDLSVKAPDIHYFKETSQYYPLFKEKIDNGAEDGIYQLRRVYVRENKSNSCFTLTASMGLGGHNVPVIRDKWGIRRLTPKECANLQGFDTSSPDQWYHLPEGVADVQLYKQIGNAVTVPLVQKMALATIQDLANPQRRRDDRELVLKAKQKIKF
jgi:DNA (cytosine-5)-methyltransferase 1